ncbi:MAG TPA: V-type ATP synthase subunit D [Candidatus Omnitrophota bacterium]|nr:V-type ATP synthase subunit D [Candidatus Omnitrophota bacterium]
MAKIRFTKGELKRQRDALKQYRRYLPTLQLKKQQLQIEILRQNILLESKRAEVTSKITDAQKWSALLSDNSVDLRSWVMPKNTLTESRNVAGVNIPVFNKVEFLHAKYDLFTSPQWIDSAIDILRDIFSLREEVFVIEDGLERLKTELRVTAQRVNLFEKVKIPEAEATIRLIKIYIGDQMANAVGRSKAAKKKIEAALYAETSGASL